MQYKPDSTRRLLVAILTAVAVVASTHGPAAGTASAHRSEPVWQPAREKSVPGADAKALPRGADPGERLDLGQAPTAEWPGRGVAVVDRGRAGQLPIWVTPADARATAPVVRVESLGRQGAALAVRLSRADDVRQAGKVRLTVGYAGFRHAYGGDWANRLQVVSTRTGQVYATRNDGTGVLSADVPVPATGAETFAVQAAAAGGAGSFAATKLAPAATWSVGESSGDFNWTYPIKVPPGAGGPEPEVSLSYSSGSVDGRTSSTNNQPSWAGEGFDVAPGGAIERKYASCGFDRTGGNNASRSTGDLCWKTSNATLSLDGRSSELVLDDATGKWRLRDDDGSKVEKLTGQANGDNDKEYWKVTTADGTEYYFGMHQLPGWTTGNPVTNSTFTVPVYGNHANEPCYTTTFATSWCQQAYVWNLDYVVDRHGNTVSLFYNVETNYYARNLTTTTVSKYVRAGHVARIEYGQRDGAALTTNAVAKVWFDTAERCVPNSACSMTNPLTYPDTPLDQACNSSTKCLTSQTTPTFWTAKRLAKVRTQVLRGTTFADVSSWTLRHSFRDPGDGTRAGLWLEAINEVGHVGAAIGIPEVNFDSIQLANRVDPVGDNLPPMNWLRVSAVHTGTGGSITVQYSAPDCKPGDLPAPDTNGRRCHPMKWRPDGAGADRTDWFHKYVVTQVSEVDRVAQSEPEVTRYEYLSAPAWRFDEADGLVDVRFKTWSQWRGYQHVRQRKGNPEQLQTITESRYFQGMDGDKRADGGVKDVHVPDSTGGTAEDHPVLSGKAREQLTYDGADLVERVVTDNWISAPRATRVHPWGTTIARQTEEAGNRQDERAGAGWRQSASQLSYDAAGRLLTSHDLNDVSTSADDTCSRHEYAENAAAGLAELPKRQLVTATACGQPYSQAQVLSDERLYYDGATSLDAVPTKGDVTRAERLSGFAADGTPTYQTVATLRYDAAGRTQAVTNALGRTTTMAYSPTAGPVTRKTITQPNGHVTTTDLEPAWGEELAVTDPAGRRTEATYDALGRISKVWQPGRVGTTVSPSDNAGTPDVEYSYVLGDDKPSTVITRTLQANGSVETSYRISDGLLRDKQLQEPAPGGGRMVMDYSYDSRGLQVKDNGPFYNDAPPTEAVLLPNESALPTQLVSTFDGAERPVADVLKSQGVEKWRTTHAHAAGAHTVDPPQGETPTTELLDIQGRLKEKREYRAGSPSGEYDKAVYGYTPAGQLASIQDPAGNRWTFEYDVRGRKVKDLDPDKGTTTYGYDDLDQLVTRTDARGVTVHYSYDEIGRRTATRAGSSTGPLLAEWAYDTLAKGSPSSATRWVNGAAYTTKVTGYDAGGRPLGNELVVPQAEGKLAGTYPISRTYNGDGEVASMALPSVGGLPAETLRYGYDGKDLPTTLSSELGSYVRGTSYEAVTEQPEVITLGQADGKWVQLKYEYDRATRRLARVVTERETLPRRISDVRYSYDEAGNVTKVTDAPDAGSGEPTDTQCFGYDHLRRLTSAWTPGSGDCQAAPTEAALGGPAPYWHSWSFDLTGNRTSETRTGPTGSTTATYTYPEAGQARPHGVTKVVTTGTGMPADGRTDNYEYDAAGNQTTRALGGAGEIFTWSAEGSLEKVAHADGKSTEYVYDADGTRLLRRDAAGTTLYLDGDTEVLLKPTGELNGTRHYEHGGQAVAVRTGTGLTWIGADHHGTATTAIDAGSQTVQRRRTDPYGNQRGAAPAAWPGQRGFVGGTGDPSTGLIHLGAREYDPTLGRFISVDPVLDPSDPQQLNGYAYSNNNPVTFTDPDGEFFWFAVIAIVRVVAPIVVREVAKKVVKEVIKKRVVQTVTRVVKDAAKKMVRITEKRVHWKTQVRDKIKTTVKTKVRWKKSIQKKTVRKEAKPPRVTRKAPSAAKKSSARNGPGNWSRSTGEKVKIPRSKALDRTRQKPPANSPSARYSKLPERPQRTFSETTQAPPVRSLEHLLPAERLFGEVAGEIAVGAGKLGAGIGGAALVADLIDSLRGYLDDVLVPLIQPPNLTPRQR